ncbi:exopolyphosphatase [Mangrovactinospora gilvigrisea]|uniref:Exopolyphosphatase n=1 Tax=Mangrovactinospora gilvigrisea TaxID=1428644 RepID=A0A1J7CBF6_9ACTN|nr:Ppx/GppA phosphatase family protein [Mangrovactinospora gilvigrisea]OIV38848.1 exopolyphosphatase [Mangrovactinospora gilvigrisea]
MSESTRVAAIDCGTNSIRLLVADVDPVDGTLKDLDRRMEIVRLGQGVDRTGRLAPEALERTFAASRRYAELIAAHGVAPDRIRFVATSASRDAENRDEFTAGIREILGTDPEVISGDEEAQLSFTGATRELAGSADAPGPYLVVDIGGGSTEFVVGTESVEASRSVDIGCVRLTERHLARNGTLIDPPTRRPTTTPQGQASPGWVTRRPTTTPQGQASPGWVTRLPTTPQGQPSPGWVESEAIAAIEADADAALDSAAAAVPLATARTFVGLAGTVTTIAGIALGLDAYDPSRIHHARIGREQVRDVTGMLLVADHEQRAAIPVMHPGRTDVICAGALILLRIMDRLELPEVVVSEHDILDGIAFSAAAAAGSQGPVSGGGRAPE